MISLTEFQRISTFPESSVQQVGVYREYCSLQTIVMGYLNFGACLSARKYGRISQLKISLKHSSLVGAIVLVLTGALLWTNLSCLTIRANLAFGIRLLLTDVYSYLKILL